MIGQRHSILEVGHGGINRLIFMPGGAILLQLCAEIWSSTVHG